jgi:hypothetical protein
MDKPTRILIAMTAIAMNMPSAYTISWSKKEHPEQAKYLYVGLIITFITLVGAFLNHDATMWAGLALSFAFFAYVSLVT